MTQPNQEEFGFELAEAINEKRVLENVQCLHLHLQQQQQLCLTFSNKKRDASLNKPKRK